MPPGWKSKVTLAPCDTSMCQPGGLETASSRCLSPTAYDQQLGANRYLASGATALSGFGRGAVSAGAARLRPITARISRHSTIHLYTEKKLPGWLPKLPGNAQFISHNRSRFLSPIHQDVDALTLDDAGSSTDLTSLPGELLIMPWGQWKWPLVISSPERAILELMDELPQE